MVKALIVPGRGNYGAMAWSLRKTTDFDTARLHYFESLGNISSYDIERLAEKGLTPEVWVWDTVRFLEERTELPDIWRQFVASGFIFPQPSSGAETDE